MSIFRGCCSVRYRWPIRVSGGRGTILTPEVGCAESARERYTAANGHLSLLLPRDFFVTSERSRQ